MGGGDARSLTSAEGTPDGFTITEADYLVTFLTCCADRRCMQLAPLLDHLKTRAGESLRAVQWYRGDQTELIYVRDDLSVPDVVSRADAIHAQLTTKKPPQAEAEMATLGDRMATVNIYDEAFLINLPFGENYGVVIGLDPIVGRSLHEFVSGCRACLEEIDTG